ncbi:MAG: hypothetical protein JSW73_02705 [Candidatus Woesearchaeota archaeon]|nr:MAG: hypothetical protein JSW73_02705 [Candidatus Woesearchaeota archaeon]
MLIDLKEHGKKYAKFKHHAWAGLGFLSVILAINYFVKLPSFFLIPVLTVLICYILMSLLLTYKYRKGIINHTIEVYHKLKDEAKIEKKKLKALVKLEKKKK